MFVPTVETHFLVFVCLFFCLMTLYFIKFRFFVVFGLKNDCLRCYCFFIWIFIEFGRSLLPFGFDQIKSVIWLWIDRFKNPFHHFGQANSFYKFASNFVCCRKVKWNDQWNSWVESVEINPCCLHFWYAYSTFCCCTIICRIVLHLIFDLCV